MARIEAKDMNFEEVTSIILKELSGLCKMVSLKAGYSIQRKDSSGGDSRYLVNYNLYTDRFQGKKEIGRYHDSMWISRGDSDTPNKIVPANLGYIQKKVLEQIQGPAQIQNSIKIGKKNNLENGVATLEFTKINR